MGLADEVGRALRDLRRERALSLSELARRSGIGKGTLSELEAGRRNPTLETLHALTTALGVPLSTALDPAARAPAPRPGPDSIAGSAVSAVLVERHEDAAAVTDVLRIRIRAGTEQHSAAHLPGTDEHVIVLSGTALVGTARHPRRVPPGAHTHWPADRPHLYAAPDGDVEAVLTVRYPSASA